MEVFLYPLLQNLGLYTPPDPTYGRYTLDISDKEKKLEADPEVKVSHRRVFIKNKSYLKGEDVKLTQEEIEKGRGKEWIYYKIWQKGPWNGSDVIVLHGVLFVGSFVV